MIPQWLVIFNERNVVRLYGPFPSKDEALAILTAP